MSSSNGSTKIEQGCTVTTAQIVVLKGSHFSGAFCLFLIWYGGDKMPHTRSAHKIHRNTNRKA